MLAQLETWLNLNDVRECRMEKGLRGTWIVRMYGGSHERVLAKADGLPEAMRQAMEKLRCFQADGGRAD